ncbi:HEAT repeat domain-containing protein [Streptomyces sp. NPDC003395]
MFTGIDDVDWASLGHAYTDTATDVPGLLWGLASDDPERREIALDGMYGAVHHQGDVYDSTVACVPFLFELVRTAGRPERGAVVELLRSIGESVREDSPLEFCGCDEDEEEWRRMIGRARALIREGVDGLVGLLDDPDPELRAALPGALAQLHPDPVRVFDALCDRLRVERAPGPARALVRAVGSLGVAHPARTAGAAAEVLTRLVAGTPDPELRLTALVQLAHCAPQSVPEDTVDICRDVLRRAGRAAPAGEDAPERPRTDTLISYLRELERDHRASVDADLVGDLLTELHHALGDRTDLRLPLLMDQLRAPGRGHKLGALVMARQLLTGWRVPAAEPVAAVGALLLDPDERVSDTALNTLLHLAPVVGPAVESLEAYIHSWDDRELEADVPWYEMALCRATEVLTLAGAPDVVPTLVSLLSGHDVALEVPARLPDWIRALGPEAAAPLGPVLRERLAALDPAVPDADQVHLVGALGVLEQPESAPLLTAVLRATDDPRTRWAVVEALPSCGTAAADAAPLLRDLLADDGLRPEQRARVARALWAVTEDARDVLPVVREALSAGPDARVYEALRAASAMGPAGAALAPELRALIAADRSTGWAGVALWRVTGNAREALPALLRGWTSQPNQRPVIARCLLDMGADAAPALPLIRAELDSPRHHTNEGAAPGMTHRLHEDLSLLRDCRRLAERLEGAAG